MKTQHLGRASLAFCVLLCGCAAAKKSLPNSFTQLPPPPDAEETRDGVIVASTAVDPQAPLPGDAQPAVPMVFQLACYQITVPVGTVSRNEAFWKRIDEQCLDPARYDLLQRNGMRLGEASVSEFENIRHMLEQTPATGRTMGTIGDTQKNIELDMRKDIPFQTVSHYGNNNDLMIRSYGQSENIFSLSYQRTPRKLGEMRLAITPTVRSLKKRLEYTVRNEEIEISYVQPEKYYLNITVDLAMDKILILGPSDTSELPTILGHQFFVKDEPAEQMEQVLFFVARPFRMTPA